MAIDRKFYKKSRLIEYILKRYIDENKKILYSIFFCLLNE